MVTVMVEAWTRVGAWMEYAKAFLPSTGDGRTQNWPI
jgi:hypothetical protein